MNSIKWIKTLQPGRSDPISALIFSPEGRYLVIAAREGDLSVWNTQSWGEEFNFSYSHQSIRQIVFVKEWKFYAFGYGCTFRVQLLEPSIENVSCLVPVGLIKTISPNEKWAASVQSLHSVFECRIEDDEIFLILERFKRMDDPIEFQAGSFAKRAYHLLPDSLLFSPDSRHLAVPIEIDDNFGWSSGIYFLQPEDDDDTIGSITEAESEISLLCFSPDSQLFAYCDSNNHSMYIIKAESPHTSCGDYYEDANSITAICFHPDNHCLVFSLDDKSVNIWDWDQQDTIGTIYRHTNEITYMAFHPNGNILAVGDDQGKIVLIHVSSE